MLHMYDFLENHQETKACLQLEYSASLPYCIYNYIYLNTCIMRGNIVGEQLNISGVNLRNGNVEWLLLCSYMHLLIHITIDSLPLSHGSRLLIHIQVAICLLLEFTGRLAFCNSTNCRKCNVWRGTCSHMLYLPSWFYFALLISFTTQRVLCSVFSVYT
jgi:hypothetical protein